MESKKLKELSSKHTGAHVSKITVVYPPSAHYPAYSEVNHSTTRVISDTQPSSNDSCSGKTPTYHGSPNTLTISSALAMIKLTSASTGDGAQQSFLLKLPFELRLTIYELALSPGSEETDNESIKFTVAQHKLRRNPRSGNHLNIYRVKDTGKNQLALLSTCNLIKDEVLHNITDKVVWRFESTDVLSCFVGTNREFLRPAAYTESRLKMLSSAKKVEVLIPEWGSWNDAPVLLTRIGAQLKQPLSLQFIDQLDKGVESRGLVAAEDCWKEIVAKFEVDSVVQLD